MSERKVYPNDIGQYQIMDEIGKGASGVVYRTLCKPFNELVAVKIIDIERCKYTLEDLRREIQAMSSCNHPNIVQYHTSFVHQTKLWMVMEYLSSGSCFDIMKYAFPGGLPEPLIATILRETLRGIEYLHHANRVHRDIKASNLIVEGGNGSSGGMVKIADFGVSGSILNGRRSTMVGTPSWIAPEIVLAHQYDTAVDIWSFGITALELSKGSAPLQHLPPVAVMMATVTNDPPTLDPNSSTKWSQSFKELVSLCLQKEPEKRPTATKLLEHKFFKQAKRELITTQLVAKLPLLQDRYQQLNMDSVIVNRNPLGESSGEGSSFFLQGKDAIGQWEFSAPDLSVLLKNNTNNNNNGIDIVVSSAPPPDTTNNENIDYNIQDNTTKGFIQKYPNLNTSNNSNNGSPSLSTSQNNQDQLKMSQHRFNSN